MDKLLEKIISNRKLHGHWLNTLSYLEYIGARKIIKSQGSNELSYSMICHISEEARHALFFKRLCDKNFEGACPTYSEDYLLAGKAASDYFQSLDRYVGNLLDNSYLSYLYVTLLVEERALSVYQVYNKLLIQNNFNFNLKSILAEEDRHLLETLKEIKKIDSSFNERAVILRNEEDRLFKQLLEEIRKAAALDWEESEGLSAHL